MENRVNKYGASTNRAPPIAFVRTGEGNKGNLKRSYRLEAGVLSGAKDWVVTTDLDKQLKFPSIITQTSLRPDIVIHSTSLKRVVWLE